MMATQWWFICLLCLSVVVESYRQSAADPGCESHMEPRRAKFLAARGFSLVRTDSCLQIDGVFYTLFIAAASQSNKQMVLIIFDPKTNSESTSAMGIPKAQVMHYGSGGRPHYSRPVPTRRPGRVPGVVPGKMPGVIPGRIPVRVPGRVPVRVPSPKSDQETQDSPSFPSPRFTVRNPVIRINASVNSRPLPDSQATLNDASVLLKTLLQPFIDYIDKQRKLNNKEAEETQSLQNMAKPSEPPPTEVQPEIPDSYSPQNRLTKTPMQYNANRIPTPFARVYSRFRQPNDFGTGTLNQNT